jgi:glycosyltransferase involved in cell wall biosynthesis
VVIQEAAAMRRMGVDAQLVNLVPNRPVFDREYPDIEMPVLYVNDPERDIDYADYDAVIATHYMSANWTRSIVAACPTIVPGYYIQDYEPFFYPVQSLEHMLARKSYLVPEGTRCFVKTQWVHDTLLAEEDLTSKVIGPSVESALFRPRVPSRPVQPASLRLVAMVRPITPRRAPGLTMRVLSQLATKYGRSLDIHIFGCSAADPDFLKLERDFEYTHWGILDRGRVASLLGQMDIFADFSSFQAMGLTALEAMASGLAVVVPQRGGASDFAQHEVNALVIDTSDEDQCLAAITRLVDDRNLTLALQQEAVRTAHAHFAERAALNILNELFPCNVETVMGSTSC